MDLDKMKRLENIRVDHKKVSEEHSKLLTSKKEELFKKAISDFADFFQGKEFTVDNRPPKFSATYKELTVTLELPKASDTGFGAYSLLKLSVSKPRKEYRITVNEIGVYPRSVIVETTYGAASKDKVDEVDEEIKKLSGEIANMKSHGESFKKSTLGFTLSKEDKSKEIDKQFPSLKELLAELFK